jgi:hypothetical protein
MTGMTRLVLLSTDHCTLCERAFEMLASMPELRGVRLDVVDVAGDEVLLERYGEHLPVLVAGGRTLTWPFDAATVAAWIDRSG